MTPSILILYTGGTIGMKEDPKTGALIPFQFDSLSSEMPQLEKFGYNLDVISFDPLIDSSDIQPAFWVKLATIIRDHYEKYTGFVILHGTDTMAYTASAMSFMLKGLEKPVVITGSQLPIGVLRTDGKENFISAIEIAAATDEKGRARVPEVCVFFQNKLFRGNRCTKDNAEEFHAFRSPNYPPLAEAGIHIHYFDEYIRRPQKWGGPLTLRTDLCTDLAILKIYPGITERTVRAVLDIPGLKGIVLETFGSGNAPTLPWFLNALQDAVSKGLPILNITQCPGGSVHMEAYATGIRLSQIGIMSGYDMTTEAAVTKMMLSTGQSNDLKDIKSFIKKDWSGEFSKRL